ncbi:MAG TPA: hypothetical protein VNA18_07205 [Nitrososphaeraceae archaeon]|nr:hypothetical protein [Nitrososphaeraceae archaeon]
MQKSVISDIQLATSHKRVGLNTIITLDLVFNIHGLIREIFSQKNWEKAYDKHDNAFRLSVFLDVRAGGKSIDKIKFVRKAVLFWTRNPKLSYRVWISIIKDETPYYPLTIEEAKSLLFDVTRTIELQSNNLQKGENEVRIDITVSWGKHLYTEPIDLHGQTETIKVIKI